MPKSPRLKKDPDIPAIPHRDASDNLIPDLEMFRAGMKQKPQTHFLPAHNCTAKPAAGAATLKAKSRSHHQTECISHSVAYPPQGYFLLFLWKSCCLKKKGCSPYKIKEMKSFPVEFLRSRCKITLIHNYITTVAQAVSSHKMGMPTATTNCRYPAGTKGGT